MLNHINLTIHWSSTWINRKNHLPTHVESRFIRKIPKSFIVRLVHHRLYRRWLKSHNSLSLLPGSLSMRCRSYRVKLQILCMQPLTLTKISLHFFAYYKFNSKSIWRLSLQWLAVCNGQFDFDDLFKYHLIQFSYISIWWLLWQEKLSISWIMYTHHWTTFSDLISQHLPCFHWPFYSIFWEWVVLYYGLEFY